MPVGFGSCTVLQSSNKILTSGLGEKDHRSNLNNVANESPSKNRFENRRRDEMLEMPFEPAVEGVNGLNKADVYSCKGATVVDANAQIGSYLLAVTFSFSFEIMELYSSLVVSQCTQLHLV
jgi:hypothetical protein